MFCDQKINVVLVLYFLFTFQGCKSVSLGQWEHGFTSYQVQESTASRRDEIKQDNSVRQGERSRAEQGLQANLPTSNQKPRPGSAAVSGEPRPYLGVPTHNFGLNSLSWSVGNVSRAPKASGSGYGYQADLAGFHRVQGKVSDPMSELRPRPSEWQGMKPVVQCYAHAMTFSASGQGLGHLLVDRGEDSPISLYQLPPYCGFSARMSWSEFELLVPYNACYVMQENDSYVLPLLWWGRPVKLICPVQISTAPLSPFVPTALCSPYGMAVQTRAREEDVLLMGVVVKGRWRPFVSEECAYHITSQPDELTFFIPYSAACTIIGDRVYLHFVIDDEEYLLSCSVPPQFPFVLSHPTSPPGETQSPTIPNAVSPAHTRPPQFPDYLYPGFHNPQLPQVYPPGPQPPDPPQPESGSPPGVQPPQQQLPVPIQASSAPALSPARVIDSHHVSNLSPGPSLYPSSLYFREPFYAVGQPLHPSYYHLPPPPLPHYPDTQLSVTTVKPLSTMSTTAPTPQMHSLQCLMGRLVVFLPFAHPDSIQVQDQTNTWLFLSSVSPLCGYMLQFAQSAGMILHSPLPACHTLSRTPTAISLTLRFWDMSMGQYRTVDLQCPYESTSENPAPHNPLDSPSPPSTTKEISLLVVPKLEVSCSSHQMSVELPSGPISRIVVKDIRGKQMSLQDAPKHCGYLASEGKDGKIRLSLELHSRCHMSVKGQMYIISVVYETVNGRRQAQLSCPVVIPQSERECNLPNEQHLPCGPGSLSKPQCVSLGCCFSEHPPACYYPMDECTIDHHFVFSVPASLTEPPLIPALLVANGNSTCKPEKVTPDYALFKIPLDGCGTRRVTVEEAVIYMVEVINRVQPISLNYGTITRDFPVRLLVECQFLQGPVMTVGYLVKTPTLGPGIKTQGVFGVQLRIAKDEQYSSYYPQYHQPLQMLLGKPLYLEVRLVNAPDPSLVLLVHFCVAYPRSGQAVWVLLYNGCPNPLDPAMHQAVLSDPPSPQRQTRRFTISTFQFLTDGEVRDVEEEIYFMCSTEICSPHDGLCVEGCFGR